MVPSFFRPYVRDLSILSPIVKIEDIRIHHKSEDEISVKLKHKLMNMLIGDFGVGFGNIIAQQYGVSSEAIDVTENIEVAAYFATRKYPSYDHIDSGGQGVIYRFRSLDCDGLIGASDLGDLERHFESGRCDLGFFDFFVQDHQKHEVFERDRWWGAVQAKERDVWTLRFATSWSVLAQMAMKAKDKLPVGKPPYIIRNERVFDWKLTRFHKQFGGMLRPRYYWIADTPRDFLLAKDKWEAQEIRLRDADGPHYYSEAESGGQWPLFIPSAAVKRKLIGVENLRSNPACEVYLFDHSEKRVTGLYRRELWPEPADDPLFGALWQVVLFELAKTYGWDNMPAVDSVKDGILDRGYRLSDEHITRDGRDDADLMRGQLEDATESIKHGEARAFDYFYSMSPRISRGDFRGAAQAAIAGLRLAPDDPDLLQGLAFCFGQLKKPKWADRIVDIALTKAPEHPWLLYMRAMRYTRKAKFSFAISDLDQAIELYDPIVCKYTDFFFLELRGVLAWVTGDVVKLEAITEELHRKGFSATEMLPQVEWLLENHPHLRSSMN